MEFWGFIYDKRHSKRDIFNTAGNNKERDEQSINSQGLKKYYVNGKWIFSTSYEYLKTFDLRKYIRKSEHFAKVLFSAELGILKFDYLEKGVFKKQLVIEKNEIKSNIGFEQLDIKSKKLIDIFDDIVWQLFKLDVELIDPHESYFKTVKNIPYNANARDTAFDIYLILNIPKALIAVAFTPFFIYYLTKILILIITTKELLTMSNFFLVLIAWIASLFIPIYLIRLAYNELTNYFKIKHKVLNDKILTMPNIGS